MKAPYARPLGQSQAHWSASVSGIICILELLLEDVIICTVWELVVNAKLSVQEGGKEISWTEVEVIVYSVIWTLVEKICIFRRKKDIQNLKSSLGVYDYYSDYLTEHSTRKEWSWSRNFSSKSFLL